MYDTSSPGLAVDFPRVRATYLRFALSSPGFHPALCLGLIVSMPFLRSLSVIDSVRTRRFTRLVKLSSEPKRLRLSVAIAFGSRLAEATRRFSMYQAPYLKPKVLWWAIAIAAAAAPQAALKAVPCDFTEASFNPTVSIPTPMADSSISSP